MSEPNTNTEHKTDNLRQQLVPVSADDHAETERCLRWGARWILSPIRIAPAATGEEE
jgi:hypothetical protein